MSFMCSFLELLYGQDEHCAAHGFSSSEFLCVVIWALWVTW